MKTAKRGSHITIDLPSPEEQREKEKGYLFWKGVEEQWAKGCLWIERRQIGPIGKWRFIKKKGKTHVRIRCLILIGHNN